MANGDKQADPTGGPGATRAVEVKAVEVNRVTLQSLEALPAEMRELAVVFRASGLFPDLQSEAQAMVKMQTGRELGVPPMQSIMGIYFIPSRIKQGNQWVDGPPKIMLGYKILAGLVERSTRFSFSVQEHDDEHCILAWFDNSKGLDSIGTSRFGIDDAKRAGIYKEKSPWEKWPARMVFARALTAGVHTYCTSILFGLPMEVDTMAPEAEVIEGTVATRALPAAGEIPKVTTWGPEGPPPDPWANFWIEAALEARGSAGTGDKDALHHLVHQVYGLEDESGLLKEKFEAAAAVTDTSLAYVIATETVGIRSRIRDWNLGVSNAPYSHEQPKAQPMLTEVEDEVDESPSEEVQAEEEAEGATA